MLIIPSLPVRRLRKNPPPALPAALLLVAATYNRTAQLNWIRLTFDRAVDISAIDVAAFYVNDDDSDEAYTGSGTATLFAANTVQVPMTVLHGSSGPGTELTASDATGIVAEDDAGAWAGVSNLELPFP